jgi:CHAT domain-containing protein
MEQEPIQELPTDRLADPVPRNEERTVLDLADVESAKSGDAVPFYTSLFAEMGSSVGSDSASVGVLDLLESPQVNRGQVVQLLDRNEIKTATGFLDIFYSQELMRYTQQKLSIRLYTFEDVQKLLAKIAEDTNTKPVMVYTFVEPTRLHLILVTPQGEPIHKVIEETNEQLISDEVQKLRVEITSPIKRRTRSYLKPAQQLYNWMIKPIEAELEQYEADTIVFAMDGPLRSMPIAALHDGEEFLVEQYGLSQIPSLNVTDARYSPIGDADVLALGASQFTELDPLPAVPVELKVIVGASEVSDDFFEDQPLWSGRSFLNDEFTIDNLRSQRIASPSIILHLATHAEFKPGQPGNSYIQLWNSRLGLDEMQTLEWRREPTVELLVLSACRTAVGDEEVKLGFAGFAVQSGAKTAMASLWYVSDEGTLSLMVEFYSYLKKSLKAQALRQAQIAMLRGEVRIENGRVFFDNMDKSIQLPPELADIGSVNLQHPYYWASFVMIGSAW